MMELRRVGVLSAGKISGAIGLFVGLLVGGFMSLISLLGVAFQPPGQGNAQAVPAVALGIGALLFAPVLYGGFGFISGVMYAALYNLIAGFVGGVELDFVQRGNSLSNT